MEELIVIRAQSERDYENWTHEEKQQVEQQFAQTKSGVYRNLERRGDREEGMGILQKLDILEGRMIGIAEERRKRGDLENRQAEIENHRLFTDRQS